MKRAAAATILPVLGFILFQSPFASGPALAGSQNLQCHAGFQKSATYPDAIQCKKVQDRFPYKVLAQKTASKWARNASCNAHMSSPQKKVWKVNGSWKARVIFICANIT